MGWVERVKITGSIAFDLGDENQCFSKIFVRFTGGFSEAIFRSNFFGSGSSNHSSHRLRMLS